MTPLALPEVSMYFHIGLLKWQEDTLGSSQMQDFFAECRRASGLREVVSWPHRL